MMPTERESELKRCFSVTVQALKPWLEKSLGPIPNYEFIIEKPTNDMMPGIFRVPGKRRVILYDDLELLSFNPSPWNWSWAESNLNYPEQKEFLVGLWTYCVAHEMIHLYHLEYQKLSYFPENCEIYIEGIAEFISLHILKEFLAHTKKERKFWAQKDINCDTVIHAIEEKRLRSGLARAFVYRLLLYFNVYKFFLGKEKDWSVPYFLPRRIQKLFGQIQKKNEVPFWLSPIAIANLKKIQDRTIKEWYYKPHAIGLIEISSQQEKGKKYLQRLLTEKLGQCFVLT